MEPFWDLKTSKYVQNLTCASSEYLASCVLSSLTSTAGQISCVFLVYIIWHPWINIASLVLYVACTMPHVACHATTDLTFGSCTMLSSLSLWLKHRNLSLSKSRDHLCDSTVHTILTTSYHMHHYNYAATGGWVFIIIHFQHLTQNHSTLPAAVYLKIRVSGIDIIYIGI